MSFPATRHSLIRRLAVTGTEDDWRQFLEDYWPPVCRFAARWGHLQLQDAEDVGAATFHVIIAEQLLQRWLQQPTAKMRTMLCSVVRNVLSNRARIDIGRQRLLREHRELVHELIHTSPDGEDPPAIDSEDSFYAAWAEELVSNAFRKLHEELLQAGKADQFRVFYGRVCEGMSNLEVSSCLGLPVTTVENYFKRSRQRLADQLQFAARQHVARYCPADDLEAEFQTEWHKLNEFLARRGGLDGLLREAFESESGLSLRPRASALMHSVLNELTHKSPDRTASGQDID